MDYRILIAEDDSRLREVLCDFFLSKGDEPIPAADGAEALACAEEGQFDAVLLDIMMPGLNGFSVCRALRKHQDVPILFLTALSDEDDKLLGYELGADDYITKPFALSLLYAKVTALVKRARGSRPQRRPAGGRRHHLGALIQESLCGAAGDFPHPQGIRPAQVPDAA